MIENELLKVFKKQFPKVKDYKNFLKFKMDEVSDWDSIGHVNFMSKIEKRFKIRFNTNDFFQLISILKIISYLKKKLNHNRYKN